MNVRAYLCTPFDTLGPCTSPPLPSWHRSYKTGDVRVAASVSRAAVTCAHEPHALKISSDR